MGSCILCDPQEYLSYCNALKIENQNRLRRASRIADYIINKMLLIEGFVCFNWLLGLNC